MQPVWHNYALWEQIHGGDQSLWLGIKGPAVNMSYSSERALKVSSCSTVPWWIHVALDGRHGQRAMLRKTYWVHIAASLRHGELYGKNVYDLPSGSAGSVHSWVHVDILESHSGLVQLSETIFHRESKPTAHYRSLKAERQMHFSLLCRLPFYNLKGKVTQFDLTFDFGC